LVAVAVALAGSEAALGLILLIEQRDFTVQAGQEFSGNVAIFHSDHDPSVPFAITVVWGDGSSSAGSAVFVGITPQQRYAYNVAASHTYAQAGTYTFTATVRDGRDGSTGSVNGAATVTPPPPPPPPPPAPPPPPPQADLVLEQEQTPARPRARGTLRYTFAARNRGPGTATGVRLSNDPPDGSTFVAAMVISLPPAARAPTGTQDACASPPEGPLTCELGSLAPGAGVEVTHVVRLGPARFARNVAQLAGVEVDPVTTDNTTSEDVAVAPPPPVPGRAANIAPVSGVVLYRPRGGTRFLPLTQETQLPFGSQIDTRRGRVRLQSARGGGAVDTADFYAGLFAIFQARVQGAVTELRLAGGTFAVCPPGLRRPAAAGSPIRRLWGDGKGRFRTRGRFGAATVRGTRWLTLDRCDGTLVRVVSGRVLVRDFVLNRSVPLRAGRSYLARARR
jgi:uncharacterized repeat protein (TIGR01451 family)